ncbi:hypothetical protein SLEP1_g57685 [Rubroshorea leprosula]|uniref:HMA domain-containing protein n=1 Tax=Rubroshorea leprosula TaxID=152421 RepID=A0AAV5MQZ6_9ROSI|nr:hypothetical protein SLEP1_g57685 [Rubroshorea leprosula]
MVLNVDLQCSKCYKKVKKLLCKFPEIQDQKYDEKANKVTIKVVSSSPEKIRDKLCCKGGRCIKSIEIPPPPPPPPPKTDPPKLDTPAEPKPVKVWPNVPVVGKPNAFRVIVKAVAKGLWAHVPVVGKPNVFRVIVKAVAEGIGANVPVVGKPNAFSVMGDPLATAGAGMEAAVEKLNKTAQSCKC